jgi:hypothetical protein
VAAVLDAKAPTRKGGVAVIKHPHDCRSAVSDELRLANEAFSRDLPELMETHYGKWTAYVGAKRKGIAAHRDTLLKKFREQYDAGVALIVKIRERSPTESMGF